MKGMTFLLAAGFFLTAVAAAPADEAPPKDGRPLSEIIKGLEDQKAGVITEIEFDDGFWEVDVHSDGKQMTLYLDPKTGKVNRRQDRDDDDEALPPKDGKPLSEIIKAVEAETGVVTEVEFDDGFWEVKALKDGRKIKLDIDPKSGKTRAKAR